MSPRPPSGAPSLSPSLPAPTTSMPPRERLRRLFGKRRLSPSLPPSPRSGDLHGNGEKHDGDGFQQGVKHVLQKERTVVEIAAVGDFQLLKLSFTNIATLKAIFLQSPVATAGHVRAREQRSRCERELPGCSRGNMG
ncbi:hypothetical protein BDA96_03G457600 [Sorghum bicolor]|uniref:Uncharacterized protein n=2 Tax=Sorghum bicolor TaxID=4558 RepID=A0A1B6Q863_SORBI|nr:uncharacterized protein LOC110433508 [Sorghum bicolor]KAG0540997.1 hypothetical protein BDA96_03G457600 [Sorghum bicolor]KXG34118.1 hypothetical protein SORBI_3003G425600 [Sorghum bicolor]|eukprot:XP_021311465.1 uncharacterized protein LOC110433508 [Sorghum bicolor]